MANPRFDMAGTTGRVLRNVLVALAVAAPTPAAWPQDRAVAAREEMVRTIEDHARYSADLLEGGRLSPKVLEMMRRVERHLFVPAWRRAQAYDDRPVPIGHGQTISQPFIVALMTDLLSPDEGDAVLEIGTGSGYQAAVLSPLVARVCTIEIIPDLGREAAGRLARLGYGNVEVRIADGYHGWPECGPFDGILVTAAADHVPPPLVGQLKPGGRMVIPVGRPFAIQHLILVEKTAQGEVTSRQLLPVRFVPFRRAAE